MKRYLCTVGTSASQYVFRHPSFQARFAGNPPARLTAEVVAQLGGEDAALDAMLPHFLELNAKDEETLRRKLSAEVHSLIRLGITQEDEVFLLSTDTPDGRVCAHLVAAYLMSVQMGLPRKNIQVISIEGLQVDDGERFRRVGMINYIQTIRRLGEERAWANVVLNPTGGFKALIPYTTLIGMLFNAPVCYIFDNGKEIITLPPLPLEFDEVRIAPLLPALNRLESEAELREAEFWKGTPYGDRETLAGLLETTRVGWVTLSGLGLIALERLRGKVHKHLTKVYLSLTAWEDLQRGHSEWKLENQLANFQQSTREQITKGIEKKEPNGSTWFKPGRTSDRWRVEWEGEALLVYRIVGHDEYMKMILDKDLKWPREKYVPFIPYQQPLK